MKISIGKIISLWFGAALLCVAELAAAQAATVFELSGSASATPSGGTARILRKGDGINQGETVTTGAASSVVIRFEDGQVAALSANSRLVISTYVYNRTDATKSNVLISLLQGGMRAVTGLIGKSRPQQVAYRAANATIGIRGTDTNISVEGNIVAVSVSDGQVSFSFGGETVILSAGQAVITTPSGATQRVPASGLAAALRAQGTTAGTTLAAAITSLNSPVIAAAVNSASQPGTPTPTPAPTPTPITQPGTTPTTTTTGGSGGAGGGTASPK